MLVGGSNARRVAIIAAMKRLTNPTMGDYKQKHILPENSWILV